MDTSKEYIKMCEKAEEIQKLASLELGNWYAYLRRKDKKWSLDDRSPIVELIKTNENGDPIHLFEDSIEHCWLPRQDQLQEICSIQSYSPIVTLKEFLKRIDYWFKDSHFTSMEQLWLAVVMKEKYNKIWDGKEWTIIDNKRQ